MFRIDPIIVAEERSLFRRRFRLAAHNIAVADENRRNRAS